MSGETNLDTLLKGLKPNLNKGSYVFVCVEDNHNISSKEMICQFQEAEGLTLIVTKEKADVLGLEYQFVASWITLTVHSSLGAVGLTAAVANALTKENISCNVVAAFYHDHLFVPFEHTQKAMAVLEEFSKG